MGVVDWPLKCMAGWASIVVVLDEVYSGHVGVQNNREKSLLGIWLYYYAKHEPSFPIVLYTNMAVSSRD